VIKGGSGYGFAIRTTFQHTLVTEIRCVGEIIHYAASRIYRSRLSVNFQPVEIFYCDAGNNARILKGIAQGSVSPRREAVSRVFLGQSEALRGAVKIAKSCQQG
jgi:hypothetical protein